MGLRKILCRLFGCDKECPEAQRPIDLITKTTLDMNSPAGDKIEKGISVQALYTDDGQPVPDLDLNASVILGSGLLENGQKNQKIKTGKDGIASLDVELAGSGYSLYEVSLPAFISKSVFYASRTNEMTAQIYLYTQPCQPASAGQIEVEISAIDYDGKPVSGADLVIEAHNDEIFEESSIDGQVNEIAPGRYKGVIKNTKAGIITLISQDWNSKLVGRTVVHILPGAPDHFKVFGSIDPRDTRPFNIVDLQVQLHDKNDNPLPPTNIQAKQESGTSLNSVLDGDNAIFRIEAIGYQYIPVLLTDPRAGIEDTVTVVFAATWITNPGIVYTGKDFATSLYVTPRPDTSTDHGTVTIQFNPELARFRKFQPSEEFDYQYKSEVVENKLILTFESEKSYASMDYIEGFYLGEIIWGCLGEGDTCFSLSGKMSPTTDPWDLCVKQKTARNDCICINIISIAGNAASKAAGDTTVNNIATVISSTANVANCCPVLTVGRHDATITPAQLTAIVGRDGIVSTRAEQRALHADNTGVRANCINIKSVPVAIPVARGTVKGNTNRRTGSILMDPGATTGDANVGVHEVGHALDLNHRNDAGALMKPMIPVSTGLNSDECEKIFRNLSKYPC